MSMLTFVVDCCVYVWRNAHGLFVDIRRHCRSRCYGSSSSLSRDATCSALVHKASPSDTSRSMLSIVVVVVVAAAQRDMKMSGARAQGLVVDIRRHHRRSCRRRCDAI